MPEVNSPAKEVLMAPVAAISSIPVSIAPIQVDKNIELDISKDEE
jgi:hypothetical protein